jgi:hypothetical protein
MESTKKHLPIACLCGLLALTLFMGCGRSGPERTVVSGKVVYAGEPVVEGVVRFQPIEGTKAPVSIAPIKAGQFSADALGGVMIGTYQVQIRSYQPSAQPTGGLGPAPAQLLPEKYNKQSEIKLTIEPGSGNIKHDFILDP